MNEFQKRRENLIEKLTENSAMLLFSGVSKIASEDEYLEFIGNRNFFYLTGITQEHSALLIVKGFSDSKAYLFVDEYNELKEKWTGKRLTYNEAKTISEIENVYSSAQLESTLSLVLSEKDNTFGKIDKLYMDFSPEIKIEDEKSLKMLIDEIKEKYSHVEVEDVYPMIRDLRMVKSPYEVDCIKKAIEATNKGIDNLILNLKEGMYEYELNSYFYHFGRLHDKRELAFPTIVAAGKNATCLHYPSQNDLVKRDEMVLFDLGYKDSGYSADITRTLPVNGHYSGKQKDVYTAVLNCNKAVIDYIRAGMTIADVQKFTVDFLRNECVRLKLMAETDDIKNYYFHNISHHLGLDTHDASLRERPLEDGNVITVEPGLYFAIYGIGVRIEDDVLIQDGKAVNLSECIAKEIPDIENKFKTRGF